MRIHYPKLRNMTYTLFECFHCFQRNKLLYFNLNMKIYKEDCSTDIKKKTKKNNNNKKNNKKTTEDGNDHSNNIFVHALIFLTPGFVYPSSGTTCRTVNIFQTSRK